MNRFGKWGCEFLKIYKIFDFGYFENEIWNKDEYVYSFKFKIRITEKTDLQVMKIFECEVDKKIFIFFAFGFF